MKCSVCKKPLSEADYSEEEKYLCTPRGFLGEGWAVKVWQYKGDAVMEEYRCKQHRTGWNLVKIFSTVEVAKKWLKDYASIAQ